MKTMAAIETSAAAIGTSMISAILRPMVDKAKEIVKDKVVDKVDDMIDFEREISSLQITLRQIEGMIVQESAEENQNYQNWLRDLVDIGYEARDVLDDFITSESVNIYASSFNSFSSYFDTGGSSSDPLELQLKVRNQLEKDIRGVRERFDEKKKEGEPFATLNYKEVRCSKNVRTHRRPEVGPYINEQRNYLFLGRKKVKEKIIERLLRPSDNRVHVVRIWGKGGIGKTTLALSIYNDERVKKEDYPSNNRIWLCIGQHRFSAKEIIMMIIKDSGDNDVESLHRKLVEKFRGNRFLIVLDDVWDIDGSEWNLLFNPLTSVGKGGVIIITTRFRKVISATNPPMLINLGPLSVKDSLLIFESHAFIDGKSNSRLKNLKHIGQHIVDKLKGHPLTLVVVGRSLLNIEPHASTWTNFLTSLERNCNDCDVITSTLKLSYNHLPQHLKMCFTYCALFSKDHVFEEKVLVEMWMAHDLIQKEEQKRPEDVGAQYFKELVYASLLQCVDGKYVMHDLIHDLALLVSNEEFATANSSLTNDQMKKVRHITITPGDYSKISCLCKSEKLLTLHTMCSESYGTTNFDEVVFYDVFKQLKSIRVLVLYGDHISEIPDNISELRHLRYLDISETTIKSLPNSLCHLYHLQVLAAPPDAILPKDIVNMVNLRHVRANLSTCKGVGKLTSLQELSSICVCKDDNIRELGDMQLLRGELTIKGLENVEKLEGDVSALMEKQTLMDELELKFDKQLERSTISEEVLDALGCPPNLTDLKIYGYTGVKSPSWMVDGKHKFDKLQTLKLSVCPKLESLPPLGELSSLKHLSLTSLHRIKRLGDEFYGNVTKSKVFFPSLESLCFRDMKEWEEWDGIGNSSVSLFPSLTELKIDECPKLVLVPPPVMDVTNFMRSLSTLSVSECDGVVFLRLDALVSLKHLEIHKCNGLARITLAICSSTAVETLRITSCEHLETMEFERLLSLKSLVFRNCNKLSSIRCPIGIKYLNLIDCERLSSLSVNTDGSNSLEFLEIYRCPVLRLTFEGGSSPSSMNSVVPLPSLRSIDTDSKHIFSKLLCQDLSCLESLNIENFTENFGETDENNFCKLTSLNSVHISSCEHLTSLPSDFHMLSSLYSLKIEYCPKLQSLPPDFHKLSSLEILYIDFCPQLQSLPVFGLPLSVKSLDILNCPRLYERCKDENCFDWHKIRHVPKITIFGEHKVHRYGGDDDDYYDDYYDDDYDGYYDDYYDGYYDDYYDDYDNYTHEETKKETKKKKKKKKKKDQEEENKKKQQEEKKKKKDQEEENKKKQQEEKKKNK